MGRRTRTLLVFSVAVWAVCVAVWIGLLATDKSSGCPGLDGDSSGFATAQSWKWLPPGNRCVYVVDGHTHVDNPASARLAVIGLLIGWPTLMAGFALAAARDRRPLGMASTPSVSS
jgi:hypothetical protein